MVAGWYAWDADVMRYWDGQRWGDRRPRTDAERRTAEPEKERLSWLVPLGYLAAVLLPMAGLALGLAVAARPGARSPTRHGIQIIALSIVVLALGLALARHR
jgi:hypothetical protein